MNTPQRKLKMKKKKIKMMTKKGYNNNLGKLEKAGEKNITKKLCYYSPKKCWHLLLFIVIENISRYIFFSFFTSCLFAYLFVCENWEEENIEKLTYRMESHKQDTVSIQLLFDQVSHIVVFFIINFLQHFLPLIL